MDKKPFELDSDSQLNLEKAYQKKVNKRLLKIDEEMIRMHGTYRLLAGRDCALKQVINRSKKLKIFVKHPDFKEFIEIRTDLQWHNIGHMLAYDKKCKLYVEWKNKKITKAEFKRTAFGKALKLEIDGEQTSLPLV